MVREEKEKEAKIARLSLFDRKASQVKEFVIVCKLYIRMRIRDEKVEEQVKWIFVIYHLTSVLFSLSSGVDYTPFQLPINLRTKPCIPYQFYEVPNNNSYSAQQPRVCAVVEYY